MPPLLDSCRAVSERAAQTLKWANQAREASLLTIALDHLTLGRAALYAAILEGRAELPRRLSASSSSPATPAAQQRSPTDDGFVAARRELDAAVSGLRRAGQQDHIPRGLLTRAWLRFLTGARTGPESAQSDLDEAWEIAARGPMPLFLADIHLHRACLFFHEQPYPWNKNPDGTPRGPEDDLAAARKIITKATSFQRDGVTIQHSYLRRLPGLEDAERALLGS